MRRGGDLKVSTYEELYPEVEYGSLVDGSKQCGDPKLQYFWDRAELFGGLTEAFEGQERGEICEGMAEKVYSHMP
eukprot:CAMPEP_0178986590 /NCGR_PEP_ID=MMETSP0795-20121207/2786_1 /TAXON_ID=88552 /ORGANISM="Amoebophrya sp., Strain Ameob2" /LENGTH=74 /DNA_ID=CAMNT_0020677663 /DNA_START=496 /DNA_END=720 /DNA_ORIENTATION=+